MKKKDDSDKYAEFEVNDFICDEHFQDWVRHPDAEAEAFWREWVQEHPDKRGALEEARNLLVHIAFKEHWPSDETVEQSLAVSLESIAGMEKPRSIYSIRWLLAAASLIGLLLISGSIFYYWRQHQAIRYATGYGAMQYIYLPDSSKVVLNGHSAVRYTAGNWKEGGPRKLWLEGEAWFDVRHPSSAAGEKGGYGSFLVYTQDLSIEVLSTEFNVKERRGRTEVVLGSGKIRIHFLHEEQKDILMKPGEKIVYDPQQELITRQTVITDNYLSWKDKKLTNATGRQIVEYVEDNYGKKVILEDTSMASRQFGGDVLLDKFDDALFALSTVMNVQIIQKNDTLIFRPR
jgi:ferric-dicitrate binding protein FerR (iron transport regulator)